MADVERQIEALRRSNAKLDTRNALLVRLETSMCYCPSESKPVQVWPQHSVPLCCQAVSIRPRRTAQRKQRLCELQRRPPGCSLINAFVHLNRHHATPPKQLHHGPGATLRVSQENCRLLRMGSPAVVLKCCVYKTLPQASRANGLINKRIVWVFLSNFTKSNGFLKNITFVQENYLKLTEEPEQRGVWWLDARARRQMMDNLRLDPDYVTFTVYEARPLRMTHAEVRALAWRWQVSL